MRNSLLMLNPKSGSSVPNGPSTTGNPSGGGRGNNPPKK